LKDKDRDFWESLREWDVIVLSETWVEKKGEDKVRERLPGGYVWRMQRAKRKKQKRKSDERDDDGHQKGVNGKREGGSRRNRRSYGKKDKIWER